MDKIKLDNLKQMEPRLQAPYLYQLRKILHQAALELTSEDSQCYFIHQISHVRDFDELLTLQTEIEEKKNSELQVRS
jgi:hypothetical protein